MTITEMQREFDLYFKKRGGDKLPSHMSKIVRGESFVVFTKQEFDRRIKKAKSKNDVYAIMFDSIARKGITISIFEGYILKKSLEKINKITQKSTSNRLCNRFPIYKIFRLKFFSY